MTFDTPVCGRCGYPRAAHPKLNYANNGWFASIAYEVCPTALYQAEEDPMNTGYSKREPERVPTSREKKLALKAKASEFALLCRRRTLEIEAIFGERQLMPLTATLHLVAALLDELGEAIVVPGERAPHTGPPGHLPIQ